MFSSRSTTSARLIAGLVVLCTLASVQVGALPLPGSDGSVALPQRCKTANIDWYLSKFANHPTRMMAVAHPHNPSINVTVTRRAEGSDADAPSGSEGGNVDSSEPNTTTSASVTTESTSTSTPATAASPSSLPSQAQSDSKALKPKTRKHHIHTVASLNAYLSKVKERRKARKAARAATAAKAKEAARAKTKEVATPPVSSVSEEGTGDSQIISERDLAYAYEVLDELD